MTEDLLLAEEWALAVISANFGGDQLFHDRGNICVAGLLLAELIVDGYARAGNRKIPSYEWRHSPKLGEPRVGGHGHR